jgi:hypothetical protein
MKSKSTLIWFVIAAALFAGIWLQQKYFQSGPAAIAALLPGLRAGDLQRVQISPAGQREITAFRTNGMWELQKPLPYPAQSAAVEALAGALEKLAPDRELTPAELRAHPNADAEFGFDNPQFSIQLEAGGQRRQLLVGKTTAPGDQVFVRVVGRDGVYLTDSAWLRMLPRLAATWRDTALVDAASACDWLVVTNSKKNLVMEFRRDATNQVWRMIRPLQARADGSRLATALQQLRNGSVRDFITDDPRADLNSYGLQPAELSVWLGRGTNLISGVSSGKSPAEQPALVYARREGWNAVVTTAGDAFAGWRGAVNDYRDPRLVTVTAPVREIEVRGDDSFTLQQRGTNGWTVAGEKFPADAENIQNYFKLLANLRVSEYVKDVVTPADLQGFGLVSPSRQITLRAAPGDTNTPLAQLLFGNTETNRVLVKRGDEDFVYALKIEDLARLPEHGWEFRDRHIWNFSPTNVVKITMNQNGKTRQLVRSGDGKWSFANGSQGIISPKDIEETVLRLGGLTASGWVGRNITEPEKYGLNPGNLSLTIDLATGEKLALDFGAELQQSQTALAAVTLDGQRWVFVMDPTLYQFVATFLTIPPSAP